MQSVCLDSVQGNGFLIASPESGRHLNPAGRRELTRRRTLSHLSGVHGESGESLCGELGSARIVFLCVFAFLLMGRVGVTN